MRRLTNKLSSSIERNENANVVVSAGCSGCKSCAGCYFEST